MSRKPINEQRILITGASSGIGRTTAIMAAEQGAHVLLCSRSMDALSALREEIVAKGGRAEVIPANVSNEREMQLVAEQVRALVGGVDTWINNAGVSIYGRLEEVTMEDARQLFETNYWGVVYGSLAALPLLKESEGTLINLGSVVSDRAMPLQGHYCASKHAVKAFTDALRMEVEEAGEPVAISLIKPSAINTPYPEHARNYMEFEPSFPPPVYDPEVVAEAILRCAVSPQRDVVVGGGGKFITALSSLAPRLMDVLMENTMFDSQRTDAPANGSSKGALMSSIDSDHHMHARRRGNYDGVVLGSSAYTWMTQRPVATAAVATMAVGALGALALLSSSSRS